MSAIGTLHPSGRITARAMGSSVHIVVVDGHDTTAPRILERINELEQLWSRFEVGSDITRLNRAGGRTTEVAPETIRLVEAMIAGHRATGGHFDPTLLVPLVEVGYQASADGSGRATNITVDLARRGSPDGIVIDREVSTIRLPIGTALDAGGVGKGLAGDFIAEEFVGHECLGVLVSIGGDVVVAGEAPEGQGWTISVLDPLARHEVDRVHLACGAVATSSTEMRVFKRGHHLIDPNSLEPAQCGVRGATVVAGSGAWAEVLAKWLVVAGPRRLDDLDRLGIAASTVTHDGYMVNHCWKQLVVEP